MKVNVVQRAGQSKLDRRCQRCGRAIVVGDRYFFLDPSRGDRSFWCEHHLPRPSDMAVSPNKQRLYRAQELLQDAADTWRLDRDSVRLLGAVDAAVRDARRVVADYLKHANGPYVYAPQADDSRAKASHVEVWEDQLRVLRRDLTPDTVTEVAVQKLVEIAAQATIYDNWHFVADAPT